MTADPTTDSSEPTSLFVIDGHTATASDFAAGPWDPGLQHGAAPASLVVHLAERMPCAAPMRVARLTIDLLRPVPIGPLQFNCEILREGRKIQVCCIELSARGAVVARATVLRVRRIPVSLPETARTRPVDVGGPETGAPPRVHLSASKFMDGIDVKVIRGGFRSLQPGALWFRARRPIVSGQAISPAMRAVIAADCCNGVSSVLKFDEWTFINGDLTVSLARDPVGEWILLDAESWVGHDGGGVAAGLLADRQGYFGRVLQSLVIEPR